MDDYVMRFLAKQRFAEMQAFQQHQAIIRAARAARPPVRVRVGLGLIRVGRWFLGQVPALDEPAAPSLSRARSGSR
jgi:hypothetical protein